MTPVSARLLVQYAGLEAKYLRGQASQLAVSRNGLWLRQGDAEHQSVIHALRVADQGVRLDDTIIFLYGKGDHFEGRIDARSAQLQSGNWLLKRAWVSDTRGVTKYYPAYRLPTTLTRAQIQESFAPPSTISFWNLPGFIKTAMTASLDEAQRARLLAQIPAGRFGAPEDVAACVAFLASEDASYVTGATLPVNQAARKVVFSQVTASPRFSACADFTRLATSEASSIAIGLGSCGSRRK